ncbi:MAG TPA: helix-turn-helix transcriptional regulator [Pyrinomonadaceae bacterium]
MSESAIATKLGNVIRERREALDISQEGLAALSELNRTYIGEIEREAVSVSVITLQKIADGLNLKLSELIRLYEQEDH